MLDTDLRCKKLMPKWRICRAIVPLYLVVFACCPRWFSWGATNDERENGDSRQPMSLYAARVFEDHEAVPARVTRERRALPALRATGGWFTGEGPARQLGSVNIGSGRVFTGMASSKTSTLSMNGVSLRRRPWPHRLAPLRVTSPARPAACRSPT